MDRIIQIEKVLKTVVRASAWNHTPDEAAARALVYAAVDLQFKRGRRYGRRIPLAVYLVIKDYEDVVNRHKRLHDLNMVLLKKARLKRRRWLRQSRRRKHG